MGLDIYLYIEDTETLERFEYSYYRKFNALQGYFVKGFDIKNCDTIKLTKDIIDEIYLILNEIKYSPERAHLLLPTYPGPFFGSYTYDNSYYNHIYQANMDFYHAKFIDFNKYNLYFTSNW